MSRQVDVKALVSHIVKGDGLDKCRICMGDTSQGQVHLGDTVMMDGDKAVTLSELLEVITGVQMESSATLPDRACRKCYTSVTDFLPFLELCRESAHKWNEVTKQLETISVNKKSLTTTAYVLLDGDPKTIYDRSQKNKSKREILRCIRVRLNDVRYEQRAKLKRLRIKKPLHGFACPECGKRCQKIKEFNRHIANAKKQCCEYCHAIIDIDSFGKHLFRKHQQMYLFKCQMCSLKFKSKYRLLLHQRVHNKGSFVCPECKMTFKTHLQLSLHTNLKHTAKICVCNKYFSNKICYRYHKRACVAREAQRFICDHCSKGFRSKTILYTHIVKIHSRDRHHQCEYCGKGFYNSHALVEHRHSHEKKPDRFTCRFCGQNFFSKGGHRTHLRDKHYRLNPELYKKERYECHICKRMLISEANLDRHIMVKHTNKRESN